MESTNGANVTITLEMYTELVCKANDLENIKSIISGCNENSYIDSDTAKVLRVLCRLPIGKETK